MVVTKAKLTYSPHHEEVARSVLDMKYQNKFLDLCFVCCKGVKVYCHKVVFCSVSSMLKEILKSLPFCADEVITVHVPDIEARILHMVLDFIYKGNIAVSDEECTKVTEATNYLGLVLLLNTDKPGSAPPPAKIQPPPQQVQPASQQMQPAQQQMQPAPIYYMSTTPNSQGQMQYMVPVSQAQMVSAPLMSTVQQPSGQLVMAQAPGQMVQQVQPPMAGTGMQQNNMMQVVQQSNAQVAPISSHMVAANQIVNGPQMVQCSNEMVVQGSQPMMITNSQMQVGLQNQVVQQQPQYVVSSTSNQMTTTTTRAPRQYNQPRGQARTVNRIQQQQQQTPSRINNVRARRLIRAPMPLVQNRTGIVNRTIQRSRNTMQ